MRFPFTHGHTGLFYVTPGVFHLVGGVCPSMPTHAFYGLVAACLLLLRRVSLSRPHAGVMCGTGDITIQLYANEPSLSLSPSLSPPLSISLTHTRTHKHTITCIRKIALFVPVAFNSSQQIEIKDLIWWPESDSGDNKRRCSLCLPESVCHDDK